MSKFGFWRTTLSWCLTIAIGFGLGYAAILGHSYWQERQSRALMVEPGDYASLLRKFNEPRALMIVRAGCSWCEKGRKWLLDNRLAVTEVDIADKALQGLKINGTPTLLLRDRTVIGFDETVWSRTLKADHGN